MTGLRSFATALAWWAALMHARGSGGSSADVALACIVAGALSGRILAGLVLSSGLVAIDAVADPSRWASAAAVLRGRSGAGAGADLGVLSSAVVPVVLGMVAAGLARRASGGARGRLEAPGPTERASWLRELVDGRPDLALRLRVMRKDWAGAAELADALGMPRSAARWWRAAGEPERARRVADEGASSGLELAERAARRDSSIEPSPKLELENPRTARFTIDPPDDDS